MDYLDAERFINEIKKNRAIWDSTSEEYKNRNLKKSQWIEICNALYPNFEEKNVKEKVAIGKELQVKWKNIRDSYVRYLRTKRTKPDAVRKGMKTYLYARHLDFLKTIMTSHSSETVADNDRCATDQVGDEAARIEQNFRKRPLPEDHLENYQPNKIPRMDEPSSDDMDFFRSLLPLIRPLPLNQKIKLRMNIMRTALEYSENYEKSRADRFQRPLQSPTQFYSSNQHFSNPYQRFDIAIIPSPNNLDDDDQLNESEQAKFKNEDFEVVETGQVKEERSDVTSPARSRLSYASDNSETIFNLQDFE